MTRRPQDTGRDVAEREDVQRVMNRWGNLPVPLADSTTLEGRRQRGVSTLRASIGSAKREAQARRLRLGLAVAAAAGFALWGGAHLLGPTRGADWTAQKQAREQAVPSSTAPSLESVGQVPAVSAPSTARSFVLGSYQLLRGEHGWIPGRADHALRAGDHVRALDQPISVSLNRITSAHLTASSALVIAALETQRQELQLLSGHAEFEVDPKRAAEVVVHASGTRIRVTGTAFSVAAHGEGTAAWSEVVVKVGHVEIFAQGERFLLSAGETWSSRHLLGDARKDRTDRMRGAHGLASRSRTPESTSVTGADTTRSLASRQGEGDEDASSTTLSEENRLLRQALSARNSGSHARCVNLLVELVSRFPSSPLRQEAVVAQFRCQRAGGQLSAAHRTALRYLSEYPRGFARDEARGLVLDTTP